VNDNALAAQIAAELGRDVPGPVMAMATELAQRAGGHTAAVLYYGSTLRSDTPEGLLDFYVLVDDVGDWPGSRLAALANRLLPPNVGYMEGTWLGQALRAKYALMSVAQFRRRVSASSLDTTLWARFCQPCVCARCDADRDAITASVCNAVISAARWAAQLGPAAAMAPDFWRALFARTYAAELRVEREGRVTDIVAADAQRYSMVLEAAWRQASLPYGKLDTGQLVPRLDSATRRSARRRWAWRQRLGRPLNILRLLKAAFTFDGAMDYVVWKIERHRGVRIDVSPWQRRFPLLAAPGLYWQLKRRGIIR
jgi:hypothetical protein